MSKKGFFKACFIVGLFCAFLETGYAAGYFPPPPEESQKTAEPAKWNWKTSGDVYDQYTWGVLGYVGIIANNEIHNDWYFDYNGLGPGVWYTVEVDRQLSKDNWARKHLAPLLGASTIELAANYTYETDPTGPISQLNEYFIVRWRDFPWNRTVLTTIGVGEGVSWASHTSQKEEESESDPGDAPPWLNYLMTEFTFALPEHPEWQVAYRLEHRSGVFGLYCPGTVGETAVGIAVRYWIS